jgi:hypothetical protein
MAVHWSEQAAAGAAAIKSAIRAVASDFCFGLKNIVLSVT